MQIVINLDEDVYTRLFDSGVPTSLADGIVIDRAIRTGTVLTECEDAISRQAVLEIAKQHTLTNDYLAIQNLPSVRPQEQTGTWKEIVKEHKCYARDDTYTTTEYHCSECGAEPLAEYASDEADYAFSNYCPNCGARMVEQKPRGWKADTIILDEDVFMSIPCEPQESEEKDDSSRID